MSGLFEMRVTSGGAEKPLSVLLEQMSYIANKLKLVVKCRYLYVEIQVVPGCDLTELNALYRKVLLAKAVERQDKQKKKRILKAA